MRQNVHSLFMGNDADSETAAQGAPFAAMVLDSFGTARYCHASGKSAARAPSRKQFDSLGVLYAHALALEYEAEARYREFATVMADYGNDSAAQLFLLLGQLETEHAFLLAKSSADIEIPVIDAGEYAWLDRGAPSPEARAFVFRMMTPHLALDIALRAEKQAKAFYERVGVESRNASVRKLAVELARDEQSHIDLVSLALARLPRPIRPDEQLLGDPTIEQRV